jgi:hypothetical protein
VGSRNTRAWERGPGGLLGRPGPGDGLSWHRSQLERGSRFLAARRAYHAAWIGHLAEPADASRLPLVSVVIPVRDGNTWVTDAVASALAQTHPRLEVVVVDDGSAVPPDRVLPRGDPRLRILRQPPRGVASARNLGVREARGELVHFLDADDVLDRDAIGGKLDAFRRIPDAELSISGYRVHAIGRRDLGSHRPPPLGDTLCPTRSLLATAVRRYPFHTSTVLVPRWVLLDAGPMDEDLEQGEDARYWLRLGLRETKVVAVDRVLGTRRIVSGGLTADAVTKREASARVHLLALHDLLGRPCLWIHVGAALRRLRHPSRWDVVRASDDSRVEILRDALVRRVAALGTEGRELAASARPVAALLREFAEAGLRERARSPVRDLLSGRLAEAAAEAWTASEPIGPRDVALWLEHTCYRRHCSSAPALRVLASEVEAGLRSGALPPVTIRQLALCWPLVTERRRWRLASRLRPWIGAAGAARAARLAEGVAAAGERAASAACGWVRVRTRLTAVAELLRGLAGGKTGA